MGKNTPEALAWDAAVRRWAWRLWLTDWDLTTEVAETLKGEGSGEPAAEVSCQPEYRQATVTAVRSYIREHPDEVDRVACHEVLHAVFSPLTMFVDHIVETMPNSMRVVTKESWRVHKESMTNRLEQILTKVSWDDKTELKRRNRADRKLGKP